MPNFPPNFAAAAAAGAAGLPAGLPNFDPSNLPQGVRELAMLQHQQMAQVNLFDDYYFSRIKLSILFELPDQSQNQLNKIGSDQR